jgi:hypothetical protein
MQATVAGAPLEFTATGKLSNHAQHVIALVAMISGAAVGIAVAFGLRRSV